MTAHQFKQIWFLETPRLVFAVLVLLRKRKGFETAILANSRDAHEERIHSQSIQEVPATAEHLIAAAKHLPALEHTKLAMEILRQKPALSCEQREEAKKIIENNKD
jgi:hypothetical protein